MVIQLLVMESFFSLVVALLILFILIVIVKCRYQILDWINRPPKPDVNFNDMKDLAVLKKYGVEDALDRVKSSQATKKRDIEELRQYHTAKPAEPEEL